jgi:hypothetical protein
MNVGLMLIKMSKCAFKTLVGNEKGIVLIGALALVALLALVSTISVTTTYTDIKISSNYKTGVQASYAAEAGYNRLIGKYLNNTNYFLAKDTAITMGLPATEPFAANFGNNLTYWFPSITYDASDPPEYVDVVSHGKAWGTNSVEKIQVRITATRSSPFDYGIFGDVSITITGNGETNSYDSSTDPTASNLLSNGDVGTNATGDGVVSLSGNSVINGDAQVGPGGNPATDITLNGNTAVNGDTGAADSAKDMTPMTDPGGGTPETLSISGNNTKTISSGTYRLPSISISGNAIGEISGDVTLYLDGNTSISGNGKLKILPGASLTIYTSGTVSISGNGIVNQNINPKPEECVLLGTASCTNVSVSGNGDLYAAIYAPAATTSVTGNGDIYGSLIGDTVTISGNGEVLFDESLQDLSVGGISGFNVTLWKYLNM